MTTSAPPELETADKFYSNGVADHAVLPEPGAVDPQATAAAAAASFDHLVIPVPTEWYTSAPPNRRWLLRDSRRPDEPGVLPLGKVGGIIAAGGIGKTMLMVDLILAEATGTRWLQTFSCPEQGRVLALVGEEDAEEMWRRIFNVARGRLTPPPGELDLDLTAPIAEVPSRFPAEGDVSVAPLAGVPCALLERDATGNTSETTFLHWLRDYVVRTGPWKLIILDPLSRFGGPDVERDNAIGTRFIQALESLATLTGATVLFTHHTTKAHGAESGRGGRGSSSIYDGCRWEVSLEATKVPLDDPEMRERLGDLVTLTFTKSNYSRKAEPLALRRDDGGPLVPLEASEHETVQKASDTKAVRAEQRKAEKAERDAEKAASDVARKADRETAKAAQYAAEEAMLITILREQPGALADELRTEMRGRLDSCASGRTDAAIVRLRTRGVLRTEARPKNGKAHFLAEERQS
jgi:RecA-family ATPase